MELCFHSKVGTLVARDRYEPKFGVVSVYPGKVKVGKKRCFCLPELFQKMMGGGGEEFCVVYFSQFYNKTLGTSYLKEG